MSPWILMMLLTTVGAGKSLAPASLSGVEFSSKERCQAGAEQMLKRFDDEADAKGDLPYSVYWVCVPK
jgi:hypothetical protein